jgi:hypothetical protein
MPFAQFAPRSSTAASIQKNAPESSGVYGIRESLLIGQDQQRTRPAASKAERARLAQQSPAKDGARAGARFRLFGATKGLD